jgi:hypothetical protein
MANLQGLRCIVGMWGWGCLTHLGIGTGLGEWGRLPQLPGSVGFNCRDAVHCSFGPRVVKPDHRLDWVISKVACSFYHLLTLFIGEEGEGEGRRAQ